MSLPSNNACAQLCTRLAFQCEVGGKVGGPQTWDGGRELCRLEQERAGVE